MNVKAYPLDVFPNVYFQSTTDEKGPLVIGEEDLVYQFGIPTKKIVAGALVDRTPSEMAAAEAVFNARQDAVQYRSKIEAVNKGSFSFDGQTFPMDETARLYYAALWHLKAPGAVRTTDGTIHTIEGGNLTNFINAFQTEIKNALTPEV